MKYKYGQRRKAGEYERALVEFWKKDRTFEQSVERRDENNSYVFYDGPPFITGNPHHGTLLSSIVKDAVPRFWTMNGKRVERRWGWDCHGLPAENFTEKHLGGTVAKVKGLPKGELELKIGDKASTISLEKYIETARDLMVANSGTWESTIDRIGRWVDFKGAYQTMDKDFMESVWWAFKELYEKGLIYEGEKVLMYDTTFATPVSKNEVTMDNDAYQTVTDPSAYVLFRMDGDFDEQTGGSAYLPEGQYEYMLAWTTTPWTLPGNMALAVNPKLKYSIIKWQDKVIYLAENLVEKVFAGEEYEALGFAGGDMLVGLRYKDLFDDGVTHDVYGADFVEDEGGTGVVHVAPAYGEDDFELAKKYGVKAKHVIDDNGYYFPEVAEKLREIGVRNTDERGIEVWAANKLIAKCLEAEGRVWKIEYVEHEYPFNPRSKQRIMYRAIPSWFFDVQGKKELLLEKNKGINWFPEYLKEGRFAKNIEQAPDWNLSRDRFWATAMPVWKGDRGSVKVVGSYDELHELTGKRLEDYHRPWVDEIEFDIDGEHFKRIDKVLDCWFESGAMLFPQLH